MKNSPDKIPCQQSRQDGEGERISHRLGVKGQ
jgi:hypothetical protein